MAFRGRRGGGGSAARKHADREHTCVICGRSIRGNAYYTHAAAANRAFSQGIRAALAGQPLLDLPNIPCQDVMWARGWRHVAADLSAYPRPPRSTIVKKYQKYLE